MNSMDTVTPHSLTSVDFNSIVQECSELKQVKVDVLESQGVSLKCGT